MSTTKLDHATSNLADPNALDIEIQSAEYEYIRQFVYSMVGIELGDSKQSLVTARLGKRLRHHRLNSFRQYIDLFSNPTAVAEREILINLITTNETYFFREAEHFDLLTRKILPNRQKSLPFHAWSAASSSGEEAYTLAMTLDRHLGPSGWRVVGSDINSQILEQARKGMYCDTRIDMIPQDYLKQYFRRGTGDYAGQILVDKRIRDGVDFLQVNLIDLLPDIGPFDIVFLRNVMIYFDRDTKIGIVRRVVEKLKPGGYLFIGMAESLKNLVTHLRYVAPSVYQKHNST